MKHPLAKKIKLIEYVSYTSRAGYVWHRKDGVDKQIRAVNIDELKYKISNELKKDLVIYDKLELRLV